MQTMSFSCPSGATLDVTALGFGGAPLGNLYDVLSEDTARATLDAAWDGGVRVFDTAPYYGLGLSEERFGRMLRDKPRGDYVLSTKFGRVRQNVEMINGGIPASLWSDLKDQGLIHTDAPVPGERK